MPVCDICGKSMAWGHGYGLSTTQVTTSEDYWKYVLGRKWKVIHEQDPQGKSLSNFIERQGSNNTPWLVCDSCGQLMEFDLQAARKYNKQGAIPPGSGPANLSRVALAAAYAWSEFFSIHGQRQSIFGSPNQNPVK